MNILITTGIFPPAAGGPATYAPKLAVDLTQRGHEVQVITLSDVSTAPEDEEYSFGLTRVKRGGKLSNYLRFFRAVWRQAKDADVVYSLSFFSYGFITALVARLRRLPYVVRVGGDYLWEQFYLYSNSPLPLKEFYTQKLYRKYPLAFRILRWTLRGADRVIFNSDVQADLYRPVYSLAVEKTEVVYNPTPALEQREEEGGQEKEIVFAGRINPMKNVAALLRAFHKLSPSEYKLVIIGNGPREEEMRKLVGEFGLSGRVELIPRLPQEQLWQRIAKARLVVLPSWTDISPNFAFECLALGVPLVITRDNYLPFRAEIPNQVDPASPEDIASTLKLLTTDEAAYQQHLAALSRISFSQTWEDVAGKHEDLFKQII